FLLEPRHLLDLLWHPCPPVECLLADDRKATFFTKSVAHPAQLLELVPDVLVFKLPPGLVVYGVDGDVVVRVGFVGMRLDDELVPRKVPFRQLPADLVELFLSKGVTLLGGPALHDVDDLGV